MPTQYLVGRDPDGVPQSLDVAEAADYPVVGFGYDMPLPAGDYPPPIGPAYVRLTGDFSGTAQLIELHQADLTGAYVLSGYSFKQWSILQSTDFKYQTWVSLRFFLPSDVTGKFKVYVKAVTATAMKFEDSGGGAGYCQINPFPDDDTLVQVTVAAVMHSDAVSNPFEITFHLVPGDDPPEPTDFWTNLVLARESI